MILDTTPAPTDVVIDLDPATPGVQTSKDVPGQGEWVVNPATGEVYSLIPDSDERDVELAVAAAENVFPLWSMMAKEKRSAERFEETFIKVSTLLNNSDHELSTGVN